MKLPKHKSSHKPYDLCTCGNSKHTSMHYCSKCIKPVVEKCERCGAIYHNSIRGMCTCCYEYVRLTGRAHNFLKRHP